MRLYLRLCLCMCPLDVQGLLLLCKGGFEGEQNLQQPFRQDTRRGSITIGIAVSIGIAASVWRKRAL